MNKIRYETEKLILLIFIAISILLVLTHQTIGVTNTIYQDLVPYATSAGGVNDGFYFTANENITITQLKIANGSDVSNVRLYDSSNNIIDTSISDLSGFFNVSWNIIENTEYHIHGNSVSGVTTYNLLNTGGYPYGDGTFTFTATDDGNYKTYTYTRLFEYVKYETMYSPVSNITFIKPPCNLNYTFGDSNIFIGWTNATGGVPPINYILYFNTSTIGDTGISPSQTESYYNWSDIDSYINSGVQYLTFSVDASDGITNNVTYMECSILVCFNDWSQTISSCNNGQQQIYYLDLNNCDNQYNIPIDNNTFTTCAVFPTHIIFDDKQSALFNIDLLDIIFLCLIGITLYFPFFMNNKQWFHIYVFTGLIFAVYISYLDTKLMTAFSDNTIYVLFVKILLYAIASCLFIFGIFGNKLMDNKKK